MVSGLFGMFFLGTLYFQRVLGYDAMQIGLAFLPVALGIGGLSIDWSARLITRFGARAVLLPGLTLVLVALVLFTRAPVGADYVVDILPAMILMGIGAGLAFPALMTLAMSEATPRDAGLASGLISTSAQVGGALGLAVLATLASSRTDALLADGLAVAHALTGGYQLTFGIGAALVAGSLVLAGLVVRSRVEVRPKVVVADEAHSQERAPAEVA
jgi:MFS family permease